MRKIIAIIAVLGVLAISSCGDEQTVKNHKVIMGELQTNFPNYSIYPVDRYNFMLYDDYELIHILVNRAGELEAKIYVYRN
jgi:hypothetical protein